MKKITSICLLFLATSIAVGQNKAKSLDSLFTSLHQADAFNGNVLIAEDGIPIYKKSFGLANEVSEEPLTEHSIFNLASLTKQFTAMAIVLLDRQGKLSVEDNFTKHLPELSHYKGISIQDLINHQSGLPSYMAVMGEEWDKSVIATNDEVIRLFSIQTPEVLYAPGEDWQYNNTGYVFLAEIIERTSGETYPDYLKKNIFEPLGMSHTGILLRFKDSLSLPKLTESYVDDSLHTKVEPYKTEEYDYVTYLDGVYGQGRLHSTTPDLLKWDRALYSDDFISDKERELIFTPYRTNQGEDTGYGYGWYIENHPTYGKIVYHTGDWTGYRTLIERHLDSDKTIIWLQNNDIATTVLPQESIRKMLYKQK